MQPPLTYSWIALTASAPVILLLTTWTLAVFHCRRRQWSTIDIFLVSILSQSTVQQFLGFIYSTLVLLKLSSISTGDAVCTGMMWFFIAIPIFKGTTITSLAVDRWLFHSKFSYRLSVRKNHIRYHIAVLAVLSCFIGFTALITFNNPELLTTTTHHPFGSSQYSFDQCTFLPFKFDLKFVIFYICVHLIIILVGMVALCKSMCHRNNNNNNAQQQSQAKHNKRRRQRSLPLDLTPTLSNTSTASSSISTTSPSAFFSTPGLTAKAVLSNNPPNNAYQIRNKMLLDFHDQNKKDEKKFYRLSTSVGLLVLSIICTHLPFTIATLLSRYDVLTPTQMGTSDDQLSLLNWPVTNIVLWFQVFEGLAILLVLLIVDNIVPGWIFNRSSQDKHHKARRMPNLTHIQPGLNLRAVEIDIKTNHNSNSAASMVLNNRTNTKAYHTNAAYSPDYKASRFPITNGSLFTGVTPTPRTPARSHTPKQDSRIGSDGFHRMLENVRGSTNNLDGFGNYGQAFQEDESEYDKKSYHQRYASVASVTTVANDDFEFHHSRPIYQHIIPNEYNQSTYVVPKVQHVLKQRIDGKKYICEELQTNSTASAAKIGVSPPPTSLSMNDLDLIEDMEFKYCDNSASNKPAASVVGTQEYKQKRMYRKRSRMHAANVAKESARHNPKTFDHPNELPRRRVSSMECLSPQTIQTDYRNFFDISYLDTGDIMVRKADSSKCIFVTDFI